jgi:uncharacterized protein (TIRG00374 family)
VARQRSFVGRLAVPLMLAAVVFLGMAVYTDFGTLATAMAGFRWPYLVLALALAAANYVVRFFRWRYYLRTAGFDVPAPRSAKIFFAGLATSITPGKLGELLKCFMLRDESGIPVVATAPVVIAERYTDLLAVIVLLGIGVVRYPAGRWLFAIGLAAVVVLFVVFAVSDKLVTRAGEFLARRFLKEHVAADTRESARVFRVLLRGTPLLVGAALGLTAWFAECVAFLVLFRGLGWQATTLLDATFVYAASTLAGALTMMPGGLGSTEASMAGLLALQGVPKAVAGPATLLVRVCTLWFAVVVGLLVYAGQRAVVDRAIAEAESDAGADEEPSP